MSNAQKQEKEEDGKAVTQPKISKAERLAKHAELNKKIWDTAYVPTYIYPSFSLDHPNMLNTKSKNVYRETNEGFHFLAAKDQVPLKTEYKPTVKVLSRKPTPTTTIASSKITSHKNDATIGMAQLGLEGSDDEDEEDGIGKGQNLSPEEMKQKAQRDREEKQRRYEEARQRLFGSSNSTTSMDGLTSKPAGVGGENMDGRRSAGRSGRGSSIAGGTVGISDGARNNRDLRRNEASTSTLSSKPRPRALPAEQGPKRQLYDPNDSGKPESVSIQRRPQEIITMENGSQQQQQQQVQQPIREPRNPDGSGRGGFGFVATRGRDAS